MNMSTAVTMGRIAGASAHFMARSAGVFYLLSILTGVAALFIRGRFGSVPDLVGAAFYVVVTLLLYYIFKPVNRSLSLLAALFSLVGCALGPVEHFHLVPSHIISLLPNDMVFFGCYCLLIGYLIFRSAFLPRILGLLMAIAGLGWLTFLSPPLANHLFPYIIATGLLGEGSLTVWLLVKGVDFEGWKAQASAAEKHR
jgi:hypothetical protein